MFQRLKKVRSRDGRQQAYQLMKVLHSLVEKDKFVLPVCIKFQDRRKNYVSGT